MSWAGDEILVSGFRVEGFGFRMLAQVASTSQAEPV